MSNEITKLQDRIDELEQETASLRARLPEAGGAAIPGQTQYSPANAPHGIRKRSETKVLGWPLWEIASGPDHRAGEQRGHARAIFAMGDVADGVVAVGGIARGGLCIGGVAMGLLTLGGVSMSLLAAAGGVAIAPLAYGGAAVGGVAVGGAAVGVYANGGAATGMYAMDSKEQDPEAVEFFQRWLPDPNRPDQNR